MLNVNVDENYILISISVNDEAGKKVNPEWAKCSIYTLNDDSGELDDTSFIDVSLGNLKGKEGFWGTIIDKESLGIGQYVVFLEASINYVESVGREQFSIVEHGSGGATPEEIWNYTERALTDGVADKVDLIKNETDKIDGIFDEIDLVKTETDKIPLIPEGVWEYVERTLTNGSGGATPEEIWNYETRTLTESIPPFGEVYVNWETKDVDGVELGKVISGGAGVKNCEVSIYLESDTAFSQPKARIFTNEEGEYEFWLNGGRYILIFRKSGFTTKFRTIEVYEEGE